MLDPILDALMPDYDHRMYIETKVDAPPDSVYRAIEEVNPDEMKLATILGWLRTFGKKTGAAPKTFSRAAERFGVTTLAENPPNEIVGGLIGRFWRKDFGIYRAKNKKDFLSFCQPDYVKVVSNFRVQEINGRGLTRLSAEIRALATTENAEKKFTVYWVLLYAGIKLYMKSGLAAIRRRAELKIKRLVP